jgi:hypothetical protein
MAKRYRMSFGPIKGIIRLFSWIVRKFGMWCPQQPSAPYAVLPGFYYSGPPHLRSYWQTRQALLRFRFVACFPFFLRFRSPGCPMWHHVLGGSVIVGFTDHPSNAGVLSDKQNLPLLLQSEGKGKPTCTSSPRSKALITAAGDKNPPSLTSIFVTSAAIAPVRAYSSSMTRSEPASSSLSPTLIPEAYRPTYFDLRVAWIKNRWGTVYLWSLPRELLWWKHTHDCVLMLPGLFGYEKTGTRWTPLYPYDMRIEVQDYPAKWACQG